MGVRQCTLESMVIRIPSKYPVIPVHTMMSPESGSCFLRLEPDADDAENTADHGDHNIPPCKRKGTDFVHGLMGLSLHKEEKCFMID